MGLSCDQLRSVKHSQQVNSFFFLDLRWPTFIFDHWMHRFYSIGLEKWYQPIIWLNKTQNHLLWCQNGVLMYLVESINQGESLVHWLIWLTESLAVWLSVSMGDSSPGPKWVYLTRPEASFYDYIGAHINMSTDECTFPDLLKYAEIAALFKKLNGRCKQNYRPVGI